MGTCNNFQTERERQVRYSFKLAGITEIYVRIPYSLLIFICPTVKTKLWPQS